MQRNTVVAGLCALSLVSSLFSLMVSMGKRLDAQTRVLDPNPLWEGNGYDIFNTNAGNVGIGTVAPAEKLEVFGNLQLSGACHGIIFPDRTVQTTAGGVTVSSYSSRQSLGVWRSDVNNAWGPPVPGLSISLNVDSPSVLDISYSGMVNHEKDSVPTPMIHTGIFVDGITSEAVLWTQGNLHPWATSNVDLVSVPAGVHSVDVRMYIEGPGFGQHGNGSLVVRVYPQ